MGPMGLAKGQRDGKGGQRDSKAFSFNFSYKIESAKRPDTLWGPLPPPLLAFALYHASLISPLPFIMPLCSSAFFR